MSDEQQRLVGALTVTEVAALDAALLAHVTERWRKVAMVVAKAMRASSHVPGVPDIFYSARVREVVDQGVVESVGNLRRMRFSEIRKPASPRDDE